MDLLFQHPRTMHANTTAQAAMSSSVAPSPESGTVTWDSISAEYISEAGKKVLKDRGEGGGWGFYINVELDETRRCDVTLCSHFVFQYPNDDHKVGYAVHSLSSLGSSARLIIRCDAGGCNEVVQVGGLCRPG